MYAIGASKEEEEHATTLFIYHVGPLVALSLFSELDLRSPCVHDGGVHMIVAYINRYDVKPTLLAHVDFFFETFGSCRCLLCNVSL